MKQEKKIYDAIVVGAGPSGCTAAHYLVAENMDILLLDKSMFPRHKPCAGGITMKTLKHLPIDIDHLVQHTAKKMKFSFDNKKTVSLQHNTGSCVMVIRDEFDNFFFEETLKKKVGFKKINKISSIDKKEDFLELDIDGQRYFTKFLIGADGANSNIRKLTENTRHNHPVSAYEGIVDRDPKVKAVTEFIFNDSGYAWIFPKSDHLNVGIGNLISNARTKKRNKDDLYDFVRERFNGKDIKNITAFPIGTEGIKYRSRDNIFLVGDSAGLAETLLGEGIYNAVLSGKYAAKSIIEACAKKSDANEIYNKFLEKLTTELSIYQKGSKLLYGFPRISYYAMKLWLGEKFMKGYSEGKSLSEIIGKQKSVIN